MESVDNAVMRTYTPGFGIDEIADALKERLQENRLPGTFLDALAQGVYRYNLYSKAGQWAAMEIASPGDGSSIRISWINASGELVGTYTIYRAEEKDDASRQH